MYQTCKYYSVCGSFENCQRCPERKKLARKQTLETISLGLKNNWINKKDLLKYCIER
jgi:hypothetical protein